MKRLWRELALIALAAVIWAGFAICTYGCTPAELQAAQTVKDVAHRMCMLTGQQKTGLSLADIEKAYCKNLDPWIGIVQDGQATGAMATGMSHP